MQISAEDKTTLSMQISAEDKATLSMQISAVDKAPSMNIIFSSRQSYMRIEVQS